MRTTPLLFGSVFCCLPFLSLSVHAATPADTENVFLPDIADETAQKMTAENDAAVNPVVEEAVYSENDDAVVMPVVTVTEPAAATVTSARMMGQTQTHTAEELLELLSRAERIAAGLDEYTTTEPIALVLNGEEIDLFKRENYRRNKALVDLAARLEAFNIVDIKVCRYWMYQRGIDTRDLPPFVQTVPMADQEVKRLQKAGYVQF